MTTHHQKQISDPANLQTEGRSVVATIERIIRTVTTVIEMIGIGSVVGKMTGRGMINDGNLGILEIRKMIDGIVIEKGVTKTEIATCSENLTLITQIPHQISIIDRSPVTAAKNQFPTAHLQAEM